MFDVEKKVKLFGRKMYFGFLSIKLMVVIFILYLIGYFVSKEHIKAIENVVITILTTLGTVVLASIGANAFISREYKVTEPETREREEEK